jgi:hypothetical protein
MNNGNTPQMFKFSFPEIPGGFYYLEPRVGDGDADTSTCLVDFVMQEDINMQGNFRGEGDSGGWIGGYIEKCVELL